MIETAALATGKLVVYGFFIGVGFWASRKFTNLVDEKLILYDNRKLRQLAKEMQLDSRGGCSDIC